MKTSSLQSLVGSPDSAAATDPPPSRAASWRWLPATIPWLLLAGFLGIAWWLFGDQLRPATPVDVVNVITARPSATEIAAGEGESETDPGLANANSIETTDIDPWEAPVQFQASGWVEPAPLPTKAPALVNGVVESVPILEGQAVKKGELLATLIQEDFELDLATAEADLASLQAQAEAHESAIKAAEAAIKTLEMQVAAGDNKCRELEDELERFTQSATGAVAERDLIQARLRLDTHESEVKALATSREELVSDLRRLEAKRAEFSAGIDRARTEVDRKQLALDRTEVRSPVDGIVLTLLAVPGQKRMLDMDDPDSSTIAILYQPDSLQTRIDVPLEEAAQLMIGQAVNLRSNFLPDRVFRGTVTSIVGEADIQRNTLQAKVLIHDPDSRLRPHMLCRAEFLTPMVQDSNAVGFDPSHASRSNRLVLFVPESALLEADNHSAAVWAIDASGDHLERRDLTLGPDRKDGHVSVREGLRPGDRVVTNPSPNLAAGERVRTRPTTTDASDS